MAASSEVRERWQELIEEYAQSGETVAAWCQFNNVAVHNFYYWKKRLSIGAPESATHTGVHQSPARCGVQWLSMDTSPHPNTDPPNAPASSPLTLIVGSIAVQVQPGFDPRLLNDVLTVVLRHDVKQRC